MLSTVADHTHTTTSNQVTTHTHTHTMSTSAPTTFTAMDSVMTLLDTALTPLTISEFLLLPFDSMRPAVLVVFYAKFGVQPVRDAFAELDLCEGNTFRRAIKAAESSYDATFAANLHYANQQRATKLKSLLCDAEIQVAKLTTKNLWILHFEQFGWDVEFAKREWTLPQGQMLA